MHLLPANLHGWTYLQNTTGMWKHLERQEGAIGTRGPGETQLESDRRHIHRKIKDAFLPMLAEKLSAKQVELRGDEAAREAVPSMTEATAEDWG